MSGWPTIVGEQFFSENFDNQLPSDCNQPSRDFSVLALVCRQAAKVSVHAAR